MTFRICITALALLGVVSACTPMEQPFKPASVEPSIERSYFTAADGTDLHLRSWLVDEPKAIVIALHGFNDYSRAFEKTGEYFNDNNISLYAYDQRGFGANKLRGIWGGKDNLTNDVRYMVKAVKNKYGKQTPIYLLGESMGGAIAINAMHGVKCPDVAGMILSAPAVWGDESMNSMYRATLWLMAHTFPASQFTGEDMDILASDNLDMLRAMGKDPLVIKETRVDAMYGIVSLMDDAYRAVEKVKKPVLMLYGANDQVIPRSPVSSAIKRMKAPHTVAYYPDGYHMLLRDLKGEVVLKDIVSWINDREKALPSGYDKGWQDELLVLKN